MANGLPSQAANLARSDDLHSRTASSGQRGCRGPEHVITSGRQSGTSSAAVGEQARVREKATSGRRANFEKTVVL